jgi:hypothetical protein
MVSEPDHSWGKRFGLLSLTPVHAAIVAEGGVDTRRFGPGEQALAELKDRLDAGGLIGEGQNLGEALEMRVAVHGLDGGVAGAT